MGHRGGIGRRIWLEPIFPPGVPVQIGSVSSDTKIVSGQRGGNGRRTELEPLFPLGVSVQIGSLELNQD